MNIETYARGQVGHFCIAEAAHFGGVQHMLTIAWILHNRVMAGQGSWLEVVASAPAKRGYEYEPPAIDYRNAHIRTFLQKLDEVAAGREDEDPTNGAIWYTDTTRPQLDWFTEAISRNRDDHQLVAQHNPFLMYD